MAKALTDHYVAGMEDMVKVMQAHIKRVYQSEKALAQQFKAKLRIEERKEDGTSEKKPE